jgi:hypothetical protein
MTVENSCDGLAEWVITPNYARIARLVEPRPTIWPSCSAVVGTEMTSANSFDWIICNGAMRDHTLSRSDVTLGRSQCVVCGNARPHYIKWRRC